MAIAEVAVGLVEDLRLVSEILRRALFPLSRGRISEGQVSTGALDSLRPDAEGTRAVWKLDQLGHSRSAASTARHPGDG